MFVLKLGDKPHPITKDITKIGRHTSNDIVLGETRVSRFHSEIVNINGRIFLLDRKTVNGTFIGDKRILPDRETLLKPDDNIGIGCPAGELESCTLKVEHSFDENNEVVSTTTTTNDSDSDQNVLGPDDDEYYDADQLCEESLERLHNTKCPVPPQRDAKELKKRPLSPSSTVSKPADSGQSSSRHPQKSFVPQVKSEPAICSPVGITNIPGSSSSQTATTSVKQPPADDINASVSEHSVVDAVNSAASSPQISLKNLKTTIQNMVQEVLAEKFPSSNMLPSLLNLSNQEAATSSESSPSQICNVPTTVNKEPSAKLSSQSFSLATNVSKRGRVKIDSKKLNVTSDDVPAASAEKAKMECIKVDLSEELENDVMEITDEPPVAPAAINETAGRVSRCTSSNNANNLTRKQRTSPEPIAKSFREDETNKRRLSEAFINLCDTNEGVDDVIEISDEESNCQPRRSRENRKSVDPNTIVIEDTRDDEEMSEDLKPYFDKNVVKTAPASPKSAFSSEPEVVPACTHNVEIPQPVLTTSVESPPSNQPKVELQLPNVSASVEHSSSNRPKAELQQSINLDPVKETLCNKQQVLFSPETVTTPVEPPLSDWQKVLFQQVVNNISTENSSINESMSSFPQSKVELSSRPDVTLQEPISDAPAETSSSKKETVAFEEVIPTELLPMDEPFTSSFIDLCEDGKPSAPIKREPLAQSNYSDFDEIITLDSDDEDFPLSQLNTTQIDDAPDFSADFERMFDDSEYVKDEPQMLRCNESTWFEPFSQTEMVEGKHVARIQLSTSESDGAITEKELQSILDKEPDGVVEPELEEAGDKMDVDEELSVSKPVADVDDFDVNQQPQSSEWRSVVKRKYHLKDCSIRLTDAQPLINRRSRKAQKVEEEVKRRPSSGVDGTLLGLNEEPVQDAATKKRPAQLSPHKVRKRKCRGRSPTMSVQEKKLIKEKRKEKLREIAPKINETEGKWKDAFRPDAKPVVKVTDKNRGSILMDTMIKEASLPKRPLKVEHSTKEKCLIKRDKPSESEPSTSKHQTHPEAAPCLPVLKENVSHSNNLKSSNDAKLADQIMNQYCKNEKPGPSRRGSICEPEDHAFANAMNQMDYKMKKEQDTRKKDSESAKKSINSTAKRHDSNNYKKSKSYGISPRPKKPKKSSLKKPPVIYGPTNIYDPPKPKKRVRFHREDDCRIIPMDALERRNNGIFASSYKLNEHLIREGYTEFETAMAKVCSWNVKWLEEQQKCFEPPPLYPESDELPLSVAPTVKYKEELKLIMFHNLWQAIFRSWNKPDNDFLPHTQFINEKTSLSTLKIESVDTTGADKKMWTIIATRTVPANDTDNDLSYGQIAILNIPIRMKGIDEQRKTMAFAYLAAITKTFTQDKESINQRMILKISDKSFYIIPGDAKLKVLSYLKSSLRPFQALAMITRSPLTDLIIDPNKTFYFEPVFDTSGEWFQDKFLDPSQQRAIANCLNCILSPEPGLCMIDGHPGSGKSQVIVSLMRELFSKHNRHRFPNDLRVLIVTAKEVVADDLSYRLEKLNNKEKLFNFLRYGNNNRSLHAKVQNYTLDKKIQDLLNEDRGNRLINLDEEKNHIKARIHSIKLVLDSTSATPEKITEAKIKLTNNEREWNDMKSENSRVIEQLKSQVAKEITIESADIIVTSVYTCWTSNFEHDFVPTHYNKGDVHKFTVCIFDDASLINEIAMLVPMMLMVQSLVLIGDHRNQIVINKSRSPFFRLLSDCARKAPSTVTELNVQYRCPPLITDWVNEFYNIKRKVKNMPPPGSKLKIKSFFVFDLPLSAMDEINYRYETQANYCSLLVEKINQLEDIRIKFGVIVAHSLQKDIIKGSRGITERGRKMVVETLDEFSGREYDVIVLCLPYHSFQYDSWLYVAVTRAKYSLFVCGDFAQLKNQACVNSLVKFAKSQNLCSQRDPFESDIPDSLIKSFSLGGEP